MKLIEIALIFFLQFIFHEKNIYIYIYVVSVVHICNSVKLHVRSSSPQGHGSGALLISLPLTSQLRLPVHFIAHPLAYLGSCVLLGLVAVLLPPLLEVFIRCASSGPSGYP